MTWENPLSVISEAFASVTGRILSFLATCWVATGTSLIVEAGCWPRSSLSDLPFLLELPMAWLGLTLLGVLQGWGLVTVVLLAIAFVMYVQHDCSTPTCLLFVFLVQSMATLVPGLGLAWSPEKTAFLMVWATLLMVWILRLAQAHGATLPLGPLTRDVTALGGEDEEEMEADGDVDNPDAEEGHS